LTPGKVGQEWTWRERVPQRDIPGGGNPDVAAQTRVSRSTYSTSAPRHLARRTGSGLLSEPRIQEKVVLTRAIQEPRLE
jgi:hypothetical protein